MSFYTKQPQISYRDSLIVQANTLLRYASASNEKTAHLDFNLGYKKLGFLTSVTYTDFDDLKMGTNGPDDYLRDVFVVSENGTDIVVRNSNPKVQKFSGYNQFNLTQKVRYEPSKSLNFDMGVHYSASSSIPRYDRLLRFSGDVPRSAEWDYGPQKWFMTNLQATKQSNQSPYYDKAKASVAYQNFQESRIDRNFQRRDRRIRKETVDAYAINIDFEKRIHAKAELFYGGTYVFNKVSSKGEIEDIRTNLRRATVSRYPNGATWMSGALYSSLKYKPKKTFIIQSGIRFNYVESKADFLENNRFLNLPFQNTKNASRAVTGTAGFSWFPNKTMQWKFNLGSAFRAPNIDDIGKVFDSEPGSVVVPNNNLKPERSYGAELGLRLDFDKKISFDVSTYYTYLDDALVRRDSELNGQNLIVYDGILSNVQAIQNASRSKIYGFEMGVKYALAKDLALTSQYSIVNGYEEGAGEKVPVRHVAPNFGNTHLVWKHLGLTADAFLNYNGALDFNALAPSEKEKTFIYAADANGNPFSPSWYTLNLRTQYKINPLMTITAALENITDQRYRPYSSGISAPGRNLILSFKYAL